MQPFRRASRCAVSLLEPGQDLHHIAERCADPDRRLPDPVSLHEIGEYLWIPDDPFHGYCSFSIFTPGIFSKSRMLTVATL